MSQLLIWFLFSIGFALPTGAIQKQVESEIERINSLRETMVQGVVPPVTESLFVSVCGPVGQSLQKLGKKTGWTVRQASHKNRNLTNKPSKIELSAIQSFKNDKTKKSFWQKAAKGSFYFQRIDTVAACLSCHGAKQSRPDFIKKKYPKDLAFDFAIGDLRGIYSVFVKKKTKR